MRAAIYRSQGAPHAVLELVDRPMPIPEAGEVRVRIHASGINPADWKARSGTRGEPMPFPEIVPHHDGAGIIDAVGHGVRDRVGERVWVWNAQWRRPRGTAAEWAVVPASQAITLPDLTSFAQGACLGIPAMTAARAVELAGCRSGMAVLVTGAGAVGALAIRLATLAGAAAIATVSDPARAGRALAAGAVATVDRQADDLREQIAALTDGRGVDAVIDLDAAANAPRYSDWLSSHGRAVVYGTAQSSATMPIHWLMRHSIAVLPFLVFDLPAAARSAASQRVTRLLEEALLPEDIAAIFSLEQIAAAHELGEGGRPLGNIVLALDGTTAHAA